MAAALAHPHRDMASALLVAMEAHEFDTPPTRRSRPPAAEILAHHAGDEGERCVDTQGGGTNLRGRRGGGSIGDASNPDPPPNAKLSSKLAGSAMKPGPLVGSLHATVVETAVLGTRAHDILAEELSGGSPRPVWKTFTAGTSAQQISAAVVKTAQPAAHTATCQQPSSSLPLSDEQQSAAGCCCCCCCR